MVGWDEQTLRSNIFLWVVGNHEIYISLKEPTVWLTLGQSGVEERKSPEFRRTCHRGKMAALSTCCLNCLSDNETKASSVVHWSTASNWIDHAILGRLSEEYPDVRRLKSGQPTIDCGHGIIITQLWNCSIIKAAGLLWSSAELRVLATTECSSWEWGTAKCIKRTMEDGFHICKFKVH